MIDRGRAFDDGELVSLGGKFPLKVITANDDRAQSEFTIQAGQYLDRRAASSRPGSQRALSRRPAVPSALFHRPCVEEAATRDD
jgi:hypothetical protein